MRAAFIIMAVLAPLACDRAAGVGSEHTVEWPGGAAPCDPESADICNGRDDDCDGGVDEDQVCAQPCRVVRLPAPRCALLADGTLRCWGLAAGGDEPWEQFRPVPVPLPEQVVQAAGSCARGVSGRVHCWGFGQTPLPVATLGNTTAAVHSDDRSGPRCARGSGPWGGTVWCWQARGGDPEDPRWLIPRREPSLGDDVAELQVGRATCARKRDGSIWCWRAPESPRVVAELGTDNAHLAAGTHVCVLKHDGRVVCHGLGEAGANALGQLGTGATDAVAGAVVATAFGAGVRQVAVGDSVTCAVSAQGAASCVGAFPFAPGRGPADAPQVTPVIPPNLESDVEEVIPPCARKRDGSLWCWGRNPGDGGPASAVPVRVDVCRERRP